MRRMLGLLGMCVLAAAGCSGTGDKPRKEPQKDLKPYEWNNVPAPETAGKDSEARALRLGDYKGKVVLVDFWAGWCPPCRRLIPHEKGLVVKHKDKPFALLGVSADNTLEGLKQAEREEGVNWRSIWDGRTGPIVRDWEVEFFPTLFLVDHKGNVRYRFEGGDAADTDGLDAAIDKLLNEVPER